MWVWVWVWVVNTSQMWVCMNANAIAKKGKQSVACSEMKTQYKTQMCSEPPFTWTWSKKVKQNQYQKSKIETQHRHKKKTKAFTKHQTQQERAVPTAPTYNTIIISKTECKNNAEAQQMKQTTQLKSNKQRSKSKITNAKQT